jgi:hypothetical protein
MKKKLNLEKEWLKIEKRCNLLFNWNSDIDSGWAKLGTIMNGPWVG